MWMKKVLCLCFLVQFTFVAGLATSKSMAQSLLEGFYVSGKVFVSQQQNWVDPSLKLQFSGTSGDITSPSFFSDTSFGAAFAVGYDFYPRLNVPIRMDVEYALRTTAHGQGPFDLSSLGGDELDGALDMNSAINVQTLMLNIYYDFHNSTRFTPYITAGAGLAFIDSSFSISADEEVAAIGQSIDVGVGLSKFTTNFAWQIGGGVSVALSPHASLDLGYRFLSLGNMDYKILSIFDAANDTDVSLKVAGINVAHEVSLGFRYTFGGAEEVKSNNSEAVAQVAQSKTEEPSVGLYVSAKALGGAQTHWSETSAQIDSDEFVASGAWTNMNTGVALALGYDFFPRFDIPVRLELEYAMRSEWRGRKTYDFQEMNVSYEPSVHVQTLMLNAAYDFHNSSRFTPYITAGIGAVFMDAQLELEILDSSGGMMSDSAIPVSYDFSLLSMGWQVGAGVEVEITPSVSLDFGYKFISFGNFDYELSNTVDAFSFEISDVKNAGTIHEFSVGLRYTF